MNDGNNNGQLCIANSGGARKAAWAKSEIAFTKIILQELGVAQVAMTERWP